MKYKVLKSILEIDEKQSIRVKNIFLREQILQILEQVNPCDQEYYIVENSNLQEIFITYKLKLNIFTYGKLKYYMNIIIVGIPFSIAKSGYSSPNMLTEIGEIVKQIKGPKMILNCDEDQNVTDFAKGITLPSCKLDLRWNCYEEYLNELRSHYRYRYKCANKKFEEVSVIELADNNEFTEDMYQLYLAVYEKSEYKLEKLSIEFFRKMPARIIKFQIRDKLLGFVQLVKEADELIFILGGINYELNKEYDIYLNMLLKIVQIGIEEKVRMIDFGQTAEEVKMKLGCKLYNKYMYVNHSNWIINKLVGRFIQQLSYKPVIEKYKVFKEIH